jgi:mRNA interferase RelE/StbE
VTHLVLVSVGAKRDLRRLPPEHRPRILDRVRSLANEPRAGAEKLAGDDAWRVRVGDYRIVFRVDDPAREVLVVRVRHRREVYR